MPSQRASGSTRRIRRKQEDPKGLSITSLLDVLTIILVFLIQNVSVEGQKVTQPENMRFPTTIANDELLKNGETVIVKIYQDQILLGAENTLVGSPKQFVESSDLKIKIREFLKAQAQIITKLNKDNKPCLIIQADYDVPCQFITHMVGLAAQASFADIYFSTSEDPQWLRKYAQAGQ